MTVALAEKLARSRGVSRTSPHLDISDRRWLAYGGLAHAMLYFDPRRAQPGRRYDHDSFEAYAWPRIVGSILNGRLAAKRYHWRVDHANEWIERWGVDEREDPLPRLLAALDAAMARLPARHWAVITSHWSHGVELRTLARAWRVSYATIRRRHVDALSRLTAALRETMPPP